MNAPTQSDMARVRRLARRKGLLAKKLPDTWEPFEAVIVQKCEIHGGACHATPYEMSHGHWRGHYDVMSGDLRVVESWLREQPNVESWDAT